jgi:hypothetical protein
VPARWPCGRSTSPTGTCRPGPGVLRIEPYQDTDAYGAATSFVREPGLADRAAVSLRPATDARAHLAHGNGRLVLARPGAGRAERARATFRIG